MYKSFGQVNEYLSDEETISKTANTPADLIVAGLPSPIFAGDRVSGRSALITRPPLYPPAVAKAFV
jgi:hypothetical protein